MSPGTRSVLLFLMFAGICFGLGYPVLNRYDPRASGGNSDSRYYYELAAGVRPRTEGHWRYRVLVPYAARPFRRLAAGRIASWDPAGFGLLCANSLFCAAALVLLASLAGSVLGDERAGLVCALLYAANFNIANAQLAGLVDSGEAMSLILCAWLAHRRRWGWLPLAALAGAAAKETFVPISIGLLAGWRLQSGRGDERMDPWVWIALQAAAGLAAVCALRWALSGGCVPPWSLAGAERADSGLLRGLVGALVSKQVLYTFGWLLPLGAWRLRSLPRPWVAGSLSAAAVAWGLAAWNGSGGNASRPLFAVLGPVLCASAAALLCERPATRPAA